MILHTNSQECCLQIWNLIVLFFLTMYTYKLLKVLPPKHLLRIYQPIWAYNVGKFIIFLFLQLQSFEKSNTLKMHIYPHTLPKIAIGQDSQRHTLIFLFCQRSQFVLKKNINPTPCYLLTILPWLALTIHV